MWSMDNVLSLVGEALHVWRETSKCSGIRGRSGDRQRLRESFPIAQQACRAGDFDRRPEKVTSIMDLDQKHL